MPHRFLIVTNMKNEGPYILEWMAHHLALGFGHVIAVTNDCVDGTDEILQRLQALGQVTHLINPAVLDQGKKQWQRRAQRYVQHYPVYAQAEWILHADVDEFVCLNDSIRDVPTLVDRMQPAHAISMTSMPFSSGGAVSLQDQPVRAQFRELTHDLTAAEPAMTAVKTLFRNDLRIAARTNHRPNIPEFSQTGLVWRDGSGNALGPEFTDTKAKTIAAAGTTDLVQLNHYAIRSVEAFLLKADRGDVAGAARLDDRPTGYYKRLDRRGGVDDRHTAMTDAAQARLDDYLADAVLGPLHRAAVEWHLTRARDILHTGEGYALARRLGLGDPGFQADRRAPPPKADAPMDRLHARACQTPAPDNPPLPTIASFWPGGSLSFFEHLAIASFRAAGHPYHLFTLGPVPNLPAGVEVRSANDVPVPAAYRCSDAQGDPGVFADLLRLYVIRDTGVIWADISTVCLSRFVFPTANVFGYEDHPGGPQVQNAILGLPPNSPALTSMIAFIESENPVPPFFRARRQRQLTERISAGDPASLNDHKPGTTGPRMVDYFLRSSGEITHAMPPAAFFPAPSATLKRLLDPDAQVEAFEQADAFSVTLTRDLKRLLATDQNGSPPAGSYLEGLCQRHAIDPGQFPISYDPPVADPVLHTLETQSEP
ncbi:MAG: glycosyltransferase family 2 protein [Pseudomonadota bacterium]